MVVLLPREEFITLQELYLKTNGLAWKENTNWNFHNISNNNPCIKRWFGLEIEPDGDKCKIHAINLRNNSLRGSLPCSFSNFSRLYILDLAQNNLYGRLPILSNMSVLMFIYFSENSFSGTIPNTIFDSNQLNRIYTFTLSHNSLSGTIPNWLFSMYLLKSINFDFNHFTGIISPNISSLSRLLYIYLNNNRLSGTLPSALSSLKRLHIFNIDNNFFSGSISHLQLSATIIDFSIAQNNFEGSLPIMKAPKLILTSNYFSGSLTEEICRSTLIQLTIIDNKFTGTIPSCLWGLPQLVITELDYNMFHGPILLPNQMLDNMNMCHVLYLTFGFNHFSGAFPNQLFKCPNLKLISAPSNCFEGGFKNFDCNNISHFTYLNLDGLYSPHSCNNNQLDIYSSWKKFGGLLPYCIISYSQEVSLAGNGFTGFTGIINEDGDDFNRPQKINLSHNSLTGTIPIPLISSKLTLISLDLSHNLFHGRIPKMNFSANRDENALILNNNRFSFNQEDVDSLPNASYLSILSGNLFSCNGKEAWKDDVSFSTQSCQTTFLLEYRFIVLFMIFLLLFFLFNLQQNISWMRTDTKSFESNNAVVFSLKRSIYYCLRLVFLIWFMLFPCYLLFHSSENLNWKFYELTYDWWMSSVYLRGTWPAVLISITLLIFNLLTLLQNLEPQLMTEHKRKRRSHKYISLFFGLYFLVFIVNIVISMSINLAFVKILNSRGDLRLGIALSGKIEDMLIQVGVALYNVVWNRYVLKMVLKCLEWRNKKDNRWEYEYGLMLLMFNNLLVPWLSVILRDESCFEGLLFGRREVSRIIGEIDCTKAILAENLRICVRRTSFSFPFIYHYQCGSQILRVYSIVWVIYYLLEMIGNLLVLFLPSSLCNLLYTEISSSNFDFARVSFDFALLLCFGIHLPYLSILVLLKMLSEYLQMCIIFTHSKDHLVFQTEEEIELTTLESNVHIENNDSEDINQVTAAQVQNQTTENLGTKDNIPGKDSLNSSLQIMLTSVTFNSVIIFDMIADEKGPKVGFLLIGCFVIVITAASFFCVFLHQRWANEINQGYRQVENEDNDT